MKKIEVIVSLFAENMSKTIAALFILYDANLKYNI